MVWLAIAAFIAVVHVAAVILGRRTTDTLQQTAFTSGLLGLFSFPLLLYVGLKSICVAGACGHGQPVSFYLALALFVVSAVVSGASVAVLAVRRSRA
ncbi:hypothetical protein ACFFGH_34185 [Lysobacter korlensis]|uniref:Integron gene cassette protein n=1 Tax=Lysobacter korlensis TaxID=553636 RepID=A0ABV6S0Z2_9GAMM